MVALQPGETVVRTGAVTWVGPPGPRPGHLTVTNHAILFEGPIARRAPPAGPGMPPGPPVVAPGELRIPLWRCRNAAVEQRPAGPILGVDLLHRRIFFRCDDAPGWAAAINEARSHAPPPPPGALERANAPGAGPGRPPKHCEYCGHQSPPSAAKCESCGAPF